MKEIQSKALSQEKGRDFQFFINEIKILQQTYDVPEASLLQILEHRFNIRKQEADLDVQLKHFKDTLSIFEERHIQAESVLRKEEEELEIIEHYLKQAESDLEIECRIKQGQVELNNEKPVPELD